MVFSSNIFLLYFLPLFLLFYFVCPKKFRNYVILVFSIVFYAYGGPEFILILLGSTTATYFIVKAMVKRKTESKQKASKWLCAAAITLNLGLLVWFKYANFLVDNINAIISLFHGNGIQLAKIVLPIGISFFTFQSITYVLDTYRGQVKPMDKLTDHIVYIMMFPQLHLSDLRGFLGLFRYGHRFGTYHGIQVPRKLQQSIRLRFHYRVLASLAHDLGYIHQRLSVYSVGRQP